MPECSSRAVGELNWCVSSSSYFAPHVHMCSPQIAWEEANEP